MLKAIGAIGLLAVLGGSVYAGWTADRWGPSLKEALANDVSEMLSVFDDPQTTSLQCLQKSRATGFKMWDDDTCSAAIIRWTNRDSGKIVASTMVKANPDMSDSPLAGLMVAMLAPALDAIAACKDSECVKQHVRKFGRLDH